MTGEFGKKLGHEVVGESNRGSSDEESAELGGQAVEIEQLASLAIEQANEEIERQLTQEEQSCLAALKTFKDANPDQTAEHENYEHRIASVILKFTELRRRLKKFLPFLLPAALMSQMTGLEAHPGIYEFARAAVADKQLKDEDITDERAAVYAPGVSEFLYRAIIPVRPKIYNSLWDVIKEIPLNLVTGRETMYRGERREVDPLRKADIPEREDAWRFYLGLPQQHGTFGVSKYQPENSGEDKYYYRVNGWFEKFVKNNLPRDSKVPPIKQILDAIEMAKFRVSDQGKKILDEIAVLRQQMKKTETEWRELNDYSHINKLVMAELGVTAEYDKVSELVREKWDAAFQRQLDRLRSLGSELTDLETWVKEKEKGVVLPGWATGGSGAGFVIAYDARLFSDGRIADSALGQTKISAGQDENGHYISYYDIWDDVEGAGGDSHLFGKPFEIYDRVYYDETTYQVK